MHLMIPTLFQAFRAWVRELLTRLLHRREDVPYYWADMQPIDFDGEDSSLRERDLQLMK